MQLSELKDHSRIWIYQSDRVLSKDEVDYLKDEGKKFVDEWAAHGSKLMAAMDVINNLFIVIAADEESIMASGCSIDSSVNWMKEMGNKLQIDLFNRLNIALKKDSGEIQIMTIDEVEKAYGNNEINERTITFNTLVKDLGEFRSGFEISLAKSWVAQRMSFT